MKWIFKRENNDIQVFVLYSDGKECSFSYIDLVKRLYEKETYSARSCFSNALRNPCVCRKSKALQSRDER